MKNRILLILLIVSSSIAAWKTITKPSAIRINQVGYLPASQKVAIITEPEQASFEITDENGASVFRGKLGGESQAVRLHECQEFAT